MAIVTKSIKASGGDYATITLWEADINNTTYPDAGTDIVGECYDEAYDEAVSINNIATNVTSVTLSAESTNRHDGTAGTGARIVCSIARNWGLFTPDTYNGKYGIQWLEFNGGGNSFSISANTASAGDAGFIRYCIIHDSNNSTPIDASARDVLFMNNFIYTLSRNGASLVGVALDSDLSTGGCFNNTVYGTANPGGTCLALSFTTDDVDARIRNNIVVGTTGLTTPKDFNFPGSTNLTSSNNVSSDATADDGGGSGHTINSTTTKFVSTSPVNLHLVSTATDCIDLGVDLVTTPTGVNIDIDGRDRDAQGDTWDIGADEFVASGTSVATQTRSGRRTGIGGGYGARR